MNPAWLDRLQQLVAAGESSVIVTIARVRGSAPREVGARMLVTAADTTDSIGGGQLEYRCLQQAAEMLGASSPMLNARLQSFPLGPECGQCCGGVVDVLFERIDADAPGWVVDLLRLQAAGQAAVLATLLNDTLSTEVIAVGQPSKNGIIDAAVEDLVSRGLPAVCRPIVIGEPVDVLLDPLRAAPFDVVLFGAGHVGSALVDVLARLDCTVYWIDSRAGMLPDHLPANVRGMPVSDPVPLVRQMPAGAHFLVMTHSHPLDLALCEEILVRDDFAYCGLIGSQSKRNRFEKRLRAVLGERFAPDRLTCPIGVRGAQGKKPAEIAIAVAAELLCSQAARCADSGRKRPFGRMQLVGN